jgi:hypothetical protein
MGIAKIYEGTWDELATHAPELRTHPKLTLIVPQAAEMPPSRYRADLSPAERIAAMDAFAETNRHQPSLPDEAFDRENLYEESP